MDPQPAPAGAQPAPTADPPTPASQPVTPRASGDAVISAPPAVGSPAGGETLEWCDVCRFWRPCPCDQCPPRLAPQGTSEALGYHHLGDLYTEDNRFKQERALKERAPTCKGIPGLRAWLTRHVANLVPLLREPPPRWQAAPKD